MIQYYNKRALRLKVGSCHYWRYTHGPFHKRIYRHRAEHIRDAQIRSRVSEFQAAAAERVIEKTALDRVWVLTRLQENVERSMQTIAVLDSDGNPTGAYQHQPMAANKGLNPGSILGRLRPRMTHSCAPDP